VQICSAVVLLSESSSFPPVLQEDQSRIFSGLLQMRSFLRGTCSLAPLVRYFDPGGKVGQNRWPQHH
jgi:hypothetical protein